MKCPRCGYEQPYTGAIDGKRYRDAVESRLQEYGYPEKMNPQKHQAAAAIRKVITIRTGIACKPGGSMPADDADEAIRTLDILLPTRTEGDPK